MSTFEVPYDLDLKSKVDNLDDETLEIYSDPNLTSHGGHLTLRYSPSHLDEFFPSLI